MDEYIKRKDVFEILQSRLDSISQMSYLNMDWHELDIMRNAIENAIDDVREVPTSDVQPVRHGKWMARTSTRDSMKCSICGNSSKQPDRYCGCCGAKMDIIYEDDKIRAIKVTG